MHEKDPSDGQERDFDLVDHEETQGVDVFNLETQGTKITNNMLIKEKEADIQAFSFNLERKIWIINYLEQENKQLTDK